MRLAQPTLNDLYPMLLKFHAKAGDCGYTVKQSVIWLESALRDPYQLVIGARDVVNPCTQEEQWVGYSWIQLQETFGFILQAYSESAEASRLLSDYGETWARERGAFTMRAGVSRKWLRALEKRWGYVVKQVIVEKRL